MIRLLVCAIACCISFPKQPIIFARCRLIGVIQTRVLPNQKRSTASSSSPRPNLATATPQTSSVLGGPSPRRGNASGSRERRGARARRTRGQKGADYAPPLEEHPLMSPRGFVSPRNKYRGDPRSRTRLHSGQAVVRGGAARTGIKVYIHIFRIFWIRGVFWVWFGLGLFRESRKM